MTNDWRSRKCRVAGRCKFNVAVKKLGCCMMHYHRWRKTGSFGAAASSHESFSHERADRTRSMARRFSGLVVRLGSGAWTARMGRGTVELASRRGSRTVGIAAYLSAKARGWVIETKGGCRASAAGLRAIEPERLRA